jgi:hypothetical protein
MAVYGCVRHPEAQTSADDSSGNGGLRTQVFRYAGNSDAEEISDKRRDEENISGLIISLEK